MHMRAGEPPWGVRLLSASEAVFSVGSPVL